VTADVLAATLANHGLHADEQAAKQRLFATVLRAFHEQIGGEATDAWWIPGRLEVFGKHTDYCGGHSLVGTVPRGFVMLARARSDLVIRMIDARRQDRFEVTAAAAGAPQALTGWRNYANVVVGRLTRNFPGASLGADIVFASDLPSASGMSSSSALMVGLATTLGTLAGLDERPEWRDNIRSPQDRAGYYACIENGLSFGTLKGDAGVGTHGGSEDHIAIVCGAAGQLSAWTFLPIRHVGTAPVPDDWTFVVGASGVAADKTGTARESYNRLSREARTLLDLWNRHEPQQPSLRAALHSSSDGGERLRRLLERDDVNDPVKPDLDRRLSHFLREDARIPHVLDAVRSGDKGALSRLSAVSQADAETLLRNQVPETIALASSARALGAFGASSFGAGFGGSVWALIECDRAAGFAEEWLSQFRRQFPERTAAVTFLARPGPPVTRVG
jgi:galactokinase